MTEEKKEKEIKETQEKKDFRYIVRIANKDLDGRLPIYRALWAIKGIGQRLSVMIAIAFEKATGIPFDSKLGYIGEDKDKILEDIVLNPQNYGIPSWAFNRRKDWSTGKDMHLVMADLDFAIRRDLQRLAEIKSYRGLRHQWGLPVRGQKTRSTHRGKGGVVGVIKKETKKASSGSKESEKKKEK